MIDKPGGEWKRLGAQKPHKKCWLLLLTLWDPLSAQADVVVYFPVLSSALLP